MYVGFSTVKNHMLPSLPRQFQGARRTAIPIAPCTRAKMHRRMLTIMHVHSPAHMQHTHTHTFVAFCCPWARGVAVVRFVACYTALVLLCSVSLVWLF